MNYYYNKKTTKLRNAIENNMLTHIKFSEAHISKIIQSGGFLDSLLSKLVKAGVSLPKIF